MATAKDGGKYQALAAAMGAAAAAGMGKAPLEWARESGMSVHQVGRLAKKLGVPQVLLMNQCVMVEVGRGTRARLGSKLLNAAFGRRSHRGLKARVFPGLVMITEGD